MAICKLTLGSRAIEDDVVLALLMLVIVYGECDIDGAAMVVACMPQIRINS